MKDKMLKAILPVGLFLYLAYRIVNHYHPLSDMIAVPWCIVSGVMELIGVAYVGWCIGKKYPPFQDYENKK